MCTLGNMLKEIDLNIDIDACTYTQALYNSNDINSLRK